MRNFCEVSSTYFKLGKLAKFLRIVFKNTWLLCQVSLKKKNVFEGIYHDRRNILASLFIVLNKIKIGTDTNYNQQRWVVTRARKS